jgi:peptidyl-prolyl cis-trans isomerase A (cyclophilin A)
LKPIQQQSTCASVFLWIMTTGAVPASSEPPPTIDSCDLVPIADADRIAVETPLGTIEIELYSNVAPLTVTNFLGYIARGDYDDTVVHRTEANFVVQTGGFRWTGVFFEPIATESPVPNEPCISNVAGTVAMAKSAGNPNSATSQWFVNLSDNSANLDDQNGGFTVFGQVLGASLDVAKEIDALGATPRPPIAPYLAAVPTTAWAIFGASPLLEPLSIDSAAHGCFDSDESGILLAENPTDRFDWEPNPALGLSYTIASSACDAGGGAGVPSVACDEAGRRVLLANPDDGTLTEDLDAEFDVAEFVVGCDGLAASEASFALRLEDVAAQLDTRFVRTEYVVPEPEVALSGAACLLALAALARGPRRRLR